MVKYFNTIYKEIRAVGIKDWLWFVIYLRRNEFSPKLSLGIYWKKYGSTNYTNNILKDRELSHEIDIKLEDVKYGIPIMKKVINKRSDYK